MAYDHISLEQKWQKFWAENKIFETKNPPYGESKPKKYILDMFPYPSGAGLHVGHPKGYTATDIVSRYYHANGYNVLHAMGFDAFGLPAENYAVKTGTHPKITTEANIAVFTQQLKALGFSYDWDRMVDTTDPEYYKWTQWIFLELFKRGLAYEAEMPVNWCPALKAVLANEEVVDGKSEIGGHPVEKKLLRQWVLKITEYADRLITDLDGLDWPDGIKEMQRNWIGKSEGCEFELRKSDDTSKSIRVYTTRVDTVYGMTYAVLAPDHPSVADFITDEYRTICEQYIAEARGKSDQDRTNEGKEKTGVFTGSYVVNPYSGESVPLWIADYVLGSYGTGAVMAVPAHDERDFEFAKKYDLPIRQSIANICRLIGESAMRDNVEILERSVVDVILENEKGEFFLIEENNPKDFHFIGGGIEEDDSIEETIKKEVAEESGYTDIQIIGVVINSGSYTEGFRHTKQKNQKTAGFFYHVKLLSHQRVSCEIDEGHHSGNWYPKDQIDAKMSWGSHKNAWDQFIISHPTTKDGVLIDSGEYIKLDSESARQTFSEKSEKEGFGHKKVNYKLRDWLFSRQRYWGEPIPLIHITSEDYAKLPREKGRSAWILAREDKNFLMIGDSELSEIYDGLTGKLIIDSSLPLLLPEVERYEPSGDGQSPLANVTEWVDIRLADNLSGKRETNTMPQWGGSCWYYLRYMDSKNPDVLASREVMEYWQSVDEYVGGAEHAVLHLLYARFWHKVLYDIGVVPTIEPFQKLTNVGLILGPDGQKMSKSRGNVINPNDIVSEYGADTLRLYEMSMGAFTDPAPWNTEAIIGVRRFLDRAYATYTEGKNIAKDEMKAMKLLHKTVKKVGEDILEYKFNTALSALMILLNEGLPTDPEFVFEWKEKFAIMLHPYAPHMAEELWNMLGKITSIYSAEWPEYDDFMLVDDEVTIAIQVNGKLRGTLTCMNGVMQDEVAVLARENPDIAKWIEGKLLVREIFIPNKMLSIVVKDAE